MKTKYRLTIRRSNGRLVREYGNLSKYAAKVRRDELEDKYDSGYYVELTPDRKPNAE
jgi:hypothetical protein